MNGQGSTKGSILLNDVPLTVKLFTEQCGFVPKTTSFIDGLTVRQMVHYTACMTLKTSNSIRRNRIKQVLSDLALLTVSHTKVSKLNLSETKRLSIALQLIRDPLLVILDDPTADLDPLNTYFVVSMLSNHAKKYGRVVLMTMDKPRSDIFPFLDRVTYLCLGDVVYTGSTRLMMDYFKSIGFPCPELENPLMYYLCLSTVDRRSRDRFIESSAQIAALVDKFKLEGNEYRKVGTQGGAPPPTIPLTAYGKPSGLTVALSLISRQVSSVLTFGTFFKRVLLLPIFFAFLYTFILPKLENQQQSFQSRSAVIFASFASVTFITSAITAYTFKSHRNRFYEESSRCNMYRGPLFIFTNILSSLPFSFITSFLSGSLIYWSAGLRSDSYYAERWIIFSSILWAIYTFSEQHTISIACFIRSPFKITLVSITLTMFYLILGSGTLRSTLAMNETKWLEYVNFANIYYYTGWTVHFSEFNHNEMLDRTPSINELGILLPCPQNVIPGRCMFVNGTHFLSQRFHQGIHWPQFSINFWRNFSLSFLFVLTSYALNIIVYVLPLPATLKAKFRE